MEAVESDGTSVFVYNGKGGKARDVPVLGGHQTAVQCAIEGKQGEDRVFDSVPSRIDVHSYRRLYAQAFYVQLSGRSLPPSTGRLKASDWDVSAAETVSKALGHNRTDVVLRHYLR